MTSNRDNLKDVSEERVALPEGFRIADDVWDAACILLRSTQQRAAWHTVCAVPDCNQSIYLVSDWRGPVAHTMAERESLMYDHLVKRHGWTRETIGER